MIHQVIGYSGVEQVFPFGRGEKNIFCSVSGFVPIQEKTFQDFFLIEVLWESRERRVDTSIIQSCLYQFNPMQK